METTDLIDVDPSILPDPHLTQIDFRDTSFFCHGDLLQPQLPEPSVILRRYNLENNPDGVVVFKDLNLVVKFGHRVRVEEAVTLRMMNLLFRNEIPTPEIFGWRTFEGNFYIYMALVQGATLHSVFDSLSENEKVTITSQLSLVVSNLRRLRQKREGPILGSLIGGPFWDLYWRHDGGAGPFQNVREYNNKLQEDAIPAVPLTERGFHDGYRGSISDSAQVFFTHADMSSRNIMIAGPPGARQIAAVIDWEQSGWYPEYWEYCKMVGCEDHKTGWLVDGWVHKVMRPYEDEFDTWSTYMLWRAP